MITGPTAGLGLRFAHHLARRGNDLVLVARTEARLAEVAEELRTSYDVDVEVLRADLGDRDQLARVEARLADLEQPVDLLVNNAGFGLKERFLDNDVATEQAMLDVLIIAVMRLSHAALGAMSSRGHGGLINVSSVAAYLPRGTYGAAKSWVNSFGEWAAAEYATDALRVMTLCPGFTRTEFHERMDVARGSAPEFMWLDADFVVSRALADFDKGRSLSVPGAQYKAVAALTRLVPHRALQAAQSLGRR